MESKNMTETKSLEKKWLWFKGKLNCIIDEMECQKFIGISIENIDKKTDIEKNLIVRRYQALSKINCNLEGESFSLLEYLIEKEDSIITLEEIANMQEHEFLRIKKITKKLNQRQLFDQIIKEKEEGGISFREFNEISDKLFDSIIERYEILSKKIEEREIYLPHIIGDESEGKINVLELGRISEETFVNISGRCTNLLYDQNNLHITNIIGDKSEGKIPVLELGKISEDKYNELCNNLSAIESAFMKASNIVNDDGIQELNTDDIFAEDRSESVFEKNDSSGMYCRLPVDQKITARDLINPIFSKSKLFLDFLDIKFPLAIVKFPKGKGYYSEEQEIKNFVKKILNRVSNNEILFKKYLDL